jgi:hypothetical protein
MRKRGLIVLMAAAPVWAGLYFWARSVEVRQMEWWSPLPPEFDHIRIGVWVAVLATMLGIGLLAADFVQWRRKKTKSDD